jgi:hypothetical protein
MSSRPVDDFPTPGVPAEVSKPRVTGPKVTAAQPKVSAAALHDAVARQQAGMALECAVRLLRDLEENPQGFGRSEDSSAERVASTAWRDLQSLCDLVVDLRVWRQLVLFRRSANDLRGAIDDESRMPYRTRVPDDRVPRVASALAPIESAADMGSLLEGLSREDRLLHAVAWLSNPNCMTPAQQAGRDWLIEQADELLTADRFPARFGARIASAWMFCSYSDHPDRHAVKRALNATIARWLHGAGVRPPPGRATPRVPAKALSGSLPEVLSGSEPEGAQPSAQASGSRAGPANDLTGPAPVDPRPTLLVVAERFLSNHAMHRVYAPSIRQLRRDFRVILVATADQVDAAGTALADQVWQADRDLHKLPALVARIARLAPDAIFFPSVGMSMWAIALANLRLAPVQMMSIGHPASSFSPHIDYMILGRDVLGDPGCFSETVIVRDAPGNPIQPPPGAWGPAPPPRVRPGTLEIAVPAMAAKVSPAFVEACQRLAHEAGRPVRFHFFPNREGIGLRHFEVLIRRALPGAVVRPPVNYTQYMRWLAECDLALATFPFGNANSTVDCLLLGKPVVALEGDEPAARTDRRMLRLAGAPAWLLATSRGQYFETALRLVRDDARRVHTARAILEADPATALFGRERDLYPDDFAEVVSWLLRNHATIRADGRKVWWPEDRRGAATEPE